MTDGQKSGFIDEAKSNGLKFKRSLSCVNFGKNKAVESKNNSYFSRSK